MKPEQLDLLRQFVRGGQKAQRSVDDIVRRFQEKAQPEPTADRDRRLKNWRASRRRRGRGDPD